jgi:hypothetical protein
MAHWLCVGVPVAGMASHPWVAGGWQRYQLGWDGGNWAFPKLSGGSWLPFHAPHHPVRQPRGHQAMQVGKSCNTPSNLILWKILDLYKGHDLWATITWISTTNNLADLPSCRISAPACDIFPHAPKLPSFHDSYWSHLCATSKLQTPNSVLPFQYSVVSGTRFLC